MPNCISQHDEVQLQTDRVAELRELLGYDVLLLHWPAGSKGTARRWKHLTADSMNHPEYLTKLAAGNIGVALGSVSGGLCAIDLDRDELIQPFITANPALADTLQTHGARGRVFWVRIDGDYDASRTLTTADDKPCGEWRADGCQSIISGTHPDTGADYRIVVRQPPVEIAYSEINFSSINQPLKKTTTAEGEAKPREIGNFAQPLQSLQSPLLLRNSVTPSLCQIADAVKMALPEVEHANHSSLWVMARAVRTLEAQGIIAGRAHVISAFDQWYQQAKSRGVLRTGQSRDKYLLEFYDAYRNVKHLLTDNPVQPAWEAAQIEPLPPEAAVFENDEAKRFVALCYQMHKQANGDEWFIPTRTAAKLFNVSHDTAARWFNGLIGLGVIVRTKDHTAEKSPRYKYLCEQPTITKEI